MCVWVRNGPHTSLDLWGCNRACHRSPRRGWRYGVSAAFAAGSGPSGAELVGAERVQPRPPLPPERTLRPHAGARDGASRGSRWSNPAHLSLPGIPRHVVVGVDPHVLSVASRVISVDPRGNWGQVAVERPCSPPAEYRIGRLPCQGKGREFEPRLASVSLSHTPKSGRPRVSNFPGAVQPGGRRGCGMAGEWRATIGWVPFDSE